jgi:hypothetical protein
MTWIPCKRGGGKDYFSGSRRGGLVTFAACGANYYKKITYYERLRSNLLRTPTALTKLAKSGTANLFSSLLLQHKIRGVEFWRSFGGQSRQKVGRWGLLHVPTISSLLVNLTRQQCTTRAQTNLWPVRLADKLQRDGKVAILETRLVGSMSLTSN